MTSALKLCKLLRNSLKRERERTEKLEAKIKKLESFKNRIENLWDGSQMIFNFNNGYGASVIREVNSITGEKTLTPLFELAVLDSGDICYTSPITDNVLYCLTWAEVEETLEKIQKLESKKKTSNDYLLDGEPLTFCGDYSRRQALRRK